MKILIDLDVLLDVIHKEEPAYSTSSAILSLVLVRELQAVLPSHALPNMFATLKQYSGIQQANDMIDWFLANFEIATLDKAIFVAARNLPLADFEDAIVACTAVQQACDFIITRHIGRFSGSPVPAVTPEEYLERY
ncbi:MAG: PIN domain-containing protein [Calditrichae bacterium]|nr:PIN domain-containing protein [Calditrichia bacterium]